ncbi:hypothetical protein N658DRAFT_242099 [Parathielavia hyrcaniae]|uniref:Extracellular membrane protein CFEM domain-containing protein n=1 Tax=Parathielavia hyrcaniae TaxID=113614 RepID=A0AAN6Q5V2_9PEZI|nr:hypothetical protein N658DRAFT_242099 [Parathielavia hyrcaniae]
MLLGRMAYWLSLLCLATLSTFPAIAAAQTTNISSEILNFVPTCAQKCFESFISANFDSGICGNSPALQCLCRQRGSSGHTIGEGAAACVAGEGMHGACQGQDGISDASTTAYNMCVGVSRAESRTHTSLVPIYIATPGGTGPLIVPTATQTATGTGTATETTATPTSTVSLPAGDESSSTTTTPAPASATSTLTPTTTASSETSESQSQLNSSQITGIALGCTAVLVFGILLVLLARCIRKRRFGDLEAGFSRMRDSKSFGKTKKNRPVTHSGPLEISSPLPRVHVERDPLYPHWQPQVPGKQAGLGLAISPPVARGGVFVKPLPALASAASSPRRPTPAADPVPVPVPAPAPPPPTVRNVVLGPAPKAKAPPAERSPPKPALALTIPQGQKRVVRVPADPRDSVVTEFAEDGEGDIAPGTAVWRPPATDPQSATTMYFADRGGNWILRNTPARRPEAGTSRRVSVPARPAVQEVAAAPVEVELPSPDHKTRAERAKDAYGGFSPDAVVSPLRLPRKPGPAERLGSPIAFRDQRREPQLSSPGLSARLSLSAETIQSELEHAKSRAPDLYFTMTRENRDLTGGRSRRRSTRRASRRVSQESATSIESAADGEDAIEDEPQGDLSPVAESPHTPISPGKSPVKYPKIRKQNAAQQAIPSCNAPEPDLLSPAHRYNVWHPPGRSSPTGSGSFPTNSRTAAPADPRRSNGPARPWNAPEIRPRDPGQPRTGSPETRRGLASTSSSAFSPPPNENNKYQYRQRQQQVANPAFYWNHQPSPSTAQPPTTTTRARPPYELPASVGAGGNARPGRYDTTPQQQYRRPTPQRFPTTDPRQQLPTPADTPLSQQLKPQQKQSQPPAVAAAAAGDTSSQSSLLAKRRGADKAAALALVHSNVGAGARTTSTATTTSSGGKGKGNDNNRAGGGGNEEKRGRKGRGGWTREEEYGPVPITPGWVPELTPTRRGGDLYLNVR